MVRKCFYSFHFVPDNSRASQVRNIGAIEGNPPVSDNEWEAVKKGGDEAIKKWIAGQMSRKECAVVLVGNATANRKWINYEIEKAWSDGLGIVGIRIHGLKNFDGKIAAAGDNPFDYVAYGIPKKKLSTIVKCYDPAGNTSKDRYDWISKHLSNAVEEAIKIRKQN